MKKRTALIGLALAVLGVALLLVRPNRSARSSSAFPLNVATVQSMADGAISAYEVQRGQIFVTVVDRYGDAHIHVLQHEGMSQEDALECLAEKKAELERK